MPEEQKSHQVSGGGVILSPASRARSWCFTVNNYTEEDKVSVVSLVSGSRLYCYGFEIGENGTPHIQGYVCFKNQTKFQTLKNKLPRAHWEKAKGSAQDNLKYCSKDGDFVTNIKKKVTREDMIELVRAQYAEVVWRPWQKDVIDLIDADNSDRTINWIYEPTGNVGKSFLCKFISLRSDVIICQGKAADIFNQVNSTIESGVLPKLVICDIPRVSLDYLSYNAIENLKNGLLYSGKYKGGKCVFPCPSVFCFANEKPKMEKLSKDRWVIYEIKDDFLFEKLF